MITAASLRLITGRISRTFDRVFARRNNAYLNIALGALFAATACFMEAGFPRDVLVFCTGTQIGFAGFWLFAARPIAKARREEMEKEMALVVAGAMVRVSEATGLDIRRIPEGELPPGFDPNTRH